MLRKIELRRYTNASDICLYLNKTTGEHEIHKGLDPKHHSSQNLEYHSTYSSFESALAALTTLNANDAKNDQENLATVFEEILEIDDDLPSLVTSPVLRRTVGFDSEAEISAKNKLMVNPQNSLVDGMGLDLKHSTNNDLKPASPIDKINFSIFSNNNPHISELKKLDSFIGIHKKK